MDARPTFIYLLHDPTDVSQRVYVGKTVKALSERWDGHLYDARSGKKRPLCHWINKLERRGVVPGRILLEMVAPGGDWSEAESFWIASLRFMGASLLNVTGGGQGQSGVIRSPETREKIAAKKRGVRRPDIGAKVAAKLTGRSRPPEIMAALHARVRSVAADNETGFRGVIPSGDGYCARLSVARKKSHLGTFDTPEEAALAFDARAREVWGAEAALNFPFPGEKSARAGIEPQQWPDLPVPRPRNLQRGMGKNSKTGFLGVSHSGTGRFFAVFRTKYLGRHDTPEEAALARDRAARESGVPGLQFNFPGPGEKSARKPK